MEGTSDTKLVDTWKVCLIPNFLIRKGTSDTKLLDNGRFLRYIYFIRKVVSLFWLCRCKRSTSPVTSNKIYQAVSVFPVAIKKHRSVPSLQLSQRGVHFFVKFGHGTRMYRKQQQEMPPPPPVTNSKIYQAVSVFPSSNNKNTGMAHPYSCLREALWSLDMELACTENSNKRSHWV